MKNLQHARWEQNLGLVFLLLAYLFGTSGLILGQDVSAEDRERLRRAEAQADRFVQRFRETLDFGVVWREFRTKNSLRMMRSFVVNDGDLLASEISDALLEEGIVSLMNYVYLKSAHDLSVANMQSNVSEEQFTPSEITKTKASSIYMKTNGKEPKRLKEFREYIAEAKKLAQLYRKYVSKASFETPEYKENLRYLAEFYKPGEDRHRVVELEEGFGLGKGVKSYRVTREVFHYGFIQENGEMKLLGIGMGN